MAITDSQKVDLLYKKLFGVAKTDTSTNKSPSNEATSSPFINRGDKVWVQANSIPTTAASTAGIVQAYQTTSAIQTIADNTTTPVGGVYPTWKTSLTDWIPPEFGATYFISAYAGTTGLSDPTTGVGATKIFDSGSGGTGEWFFDYQAGVLNFIGTTIPTPLTSANTVYITGYRYIGQIGISTMAANTIYTQGVDATQNANIIVIQGTDVGQNARMAIIEGTDVSQNARMTIIEGTDVGQNTRLTVIEGTDVSQNVRLDYSNSTITIIQGVDTSQNARMTIIEGVDVTQNTNIANKLNLTGSLNQTVSGNVIFSNDVTVTGNLLVLGNTTTFRTSQLDIGDSLIYLANNNYLSDIVDIGIIGHYNPGSSNAHTGIFRDPVRKEWIFFQGYQPEVQSNNIIDTNDASFAYANVWSSYFKGNLIATTSVVNGINLSTYTQAIYDQANVTIGVDATQNSRMTIIEGVNASQNVRLDYSNTAINIIQGVDVTQNTSIAATDGKMQSAYNQANTGTVLAQASYNQSNASFLGVNTAITIIQGVDLAQNTAIAATNGKMESAYNKANTGGGGGVTSITGTANQITANVSAPNVLLSLPQDIGTSSNVQHGSFGVGTAASGTLGEIRAINNITAFYSSDRKFKENVETIPNALDSVDVIGGKLFDWTDDYLEAHGGENDYFLRKEDFGVIAQDVQSVFPRAVRIRPDGSLAVDYEKLVALAFAAIKELNHNNDVLVELIKELSQKVKDLESK